MHPFGFIAALVLCVFALSGCGGNIIPLSYPTLRDASYGVAETGATVCIVDFENKRDGHAVGQRQDGTAILPRTPVERWLASGLAEELSRLGHAVTMAETIQQALAARADYIVSGEAEEVWLAETSLTRYTGTIRVSISLFDSGGGHITRNGYNSVHSKTVLPVYGVPRTLLDDALVEILRPAANLLHKTMQ